MAIMKKVHFSIRLEPALLKRLKRAAVLWGVSASSLARKSVQLYLDEQIFGEMRRPR